MTDLHVVYRHEPGPAGTWAAYSYPVSVYVDGSTLAEVRAGFRDAAEFALDGLDDHQFVEHIEEPLVEGAFIRTAVDRRSLDRQDVAALFASMLTVPGQRADFESRAPLGGSGDAVVVAATASDTIGWLLDQMGEHDALSICVAAPGRMIWWSYLAGAKAELGDLDTETLAEGGLTPESTLSDFIRSESRRPSSNDLPADGFHPGLVATVA